jgi:hypothetical protein
MAMLPRPIRPMPKELQITRATLLTAKEYDTSFKTGELPKKALITNCNNCGAPLHDHNCEYCKTEY